MRNPTALRRSRGFTTANILPIVFIFIVAFLGIASFVTQQMTLSRISRGKYAAQLMAESGIDVATQKIIANGAYTGETFSLNGASASSPFGSVTVSVATISSAKYRVTSVGSYRDGTTATVVAIVQNSARALGSAAIMANGNVNIVGDANIATVPSNRNVADVLANGNASVTGNAVVDGMLGAVGTATAPTGSVYSIYSGMDPIPFPTKSDMDGWKSSWLTTAQAGGTMNGNITGNTTIVGSRYINGSVNFTSDRKLTLKGPGVVYVKGNVSIGAQSSIDNGCVLVVEGTFTMNGQSTYKIDKTITNPTPSLFIYGNEPSDPTTVTCTLLGGASNESFGIVNVCYGSLKVGGNSDFTGSLTINQGNVEVKVVGTYNHYFPTDYAPPVSFPNKIGVQYVVEM